MSINKVQDAESVNEWINWIENAISKKQIKYYKFEDFSNIQEIGAGAFGKTFRANCKTTDQYFALKSFFNLNNDTVKKIVHQLGHHREVAFHMNVIRFYGITKLDSKNEIDQSTNYLLVMEYADGGTLRDYLMKNFNNLSLKDKYNLAYQLAHVVSCLHEEEILHHDLHPYSILVHQNSIKLADIGLSKGIEEISGSLIKLRGIPYVDPKKFGDQSYTLDKKSDVYSVGILLWEILNGKPPFEGKTALVLAFQILQGLREKVNSDNLLIDYVKLYTECWNNEPEKRPSMHEVAKRLKAIMDNHGENDDDLSSKSDIRAENSLQGLYRLINNTSTTSISSVDEMELNGIVKDIVIKIEEITEDLSEESGQLFCFNNYLHNYSIDTKNIYDRLVNNQNNPDSIFLLGYFNYLGFERSRNDEKAFSLFFNAAEKDHLLAQYYVGKCYESGIGTEKNEDLAFKYFEKFVNKDYSTRKLIDNQCSNVDIKKGLKLAAHWYERAVHNGSEIAMCNLGLLYINGNNVDKEKAFGLFKKSAEGRYPGGIAMLGYCYYHGIGTEPDLQKAYNLYQESAQLGNDIAQYNLAFMHERGKGVKKDVNRAIELYEKLARQGNREAQCQLDMLNERGNHLCKII
ncbi:hypothetical protein RclHR1_07130012 [Rhizophagus clarus]|uniref:Kinase-like domain-containing protein n=1 Tax=Rhizophagus clarus TaxID=94130 RepID=A0A2Z6S1K6_9GLOM|nr:hypothetical protein RclHR1_07130012 [Rhizophagus clarus]GES87939.1 kinase-like domain-containing protein [Rhizophagus clarus]